MRSLRRNVFPGDPLAVALKLATPATPPPPPPLFGGFWRGRMGLKNQGVGVCLSRHAPSLCIGCQRKNR